MSQDIIHFEDILRTTAGADRRLSHHKLARRRRKRRRENNNDVPTKIHKILQGHSPKFRQKRGYDDSPWQRQNSNGLSRRTWSHRPSTWTTQWAALFQQGLSLMDWK